MKKTVSAVILMMLLFGMITLAFDIQPAKAGETIYIRPNGSVEGTDKIHRDGDVYTFTDNIYDSIVIEKDNIVVDGAGYTLQGTGSGIGIDLSYRSNVKIRDTTIRQFRYGVFLGSSSYNNIFGSNITANNGYGFYLQQSSYNNISGNNIIANHAYGIRIGDSPCNNNNIIGNIIAEHDQCGIAISDSSDSTIDGNIIANNEDGISLWAANVVCSNNRISGNHIATNTRGIVLRQSWNNNIYHNNFINNSNQVYTEGSVDIWDDGYPSGGNYWSDYVSSDLVNGPYRNITGSDGIGDTPYVIDLNNQDNYPLTRPYVPFENQTIYIRAGGSIDPSGAPIHWTGDLYTLTDNITSNGDGIIIERNNITLEGGANHTLQGIGDGNGLYLLERSNVTIKNTTIKGFTYGIFLYSSLSNSISGNNITNNQYGIGLYTSSNYNSISGNNITANSGNGIYLYSSSNYNSISGNNITANNCYGIFLYSSSNYNSIFHNNFINNTNQVYSSDSVNTWDDGYPSGGNYWSDYEERYPNATEINDSGIWNTPYVIDANNKDNYPIIPEFPSGVILPLFMMVTLIAILLLRRKRRILCSQTK